MSTSLVSTTRTTGQARRVLARLALAASQLVAAYERYGPDQPWGSLTRRARVQPPLLPRLGELPRRPTA